MFYLFRRKLYSFFRIISLGLAFALGQGSFLPNPAFAQTLSQAPSPVLLSSAFTPALVRGIRIHPNNPFQFDFIIDSGDTGLKTDALKEESEKLIRYFLASLTLPENDLWVNLSPYEKDRIVPNELGQTEMGIDMLAQDYLLKQITASLTNPESDIGKDFWSKVYKKAYEQYGTTNIPVDTFNKVWIMPDKATVYVQEDKAFIVESRLKVMLEEDYVAKEKGLEGQRIIGAEESQKSEVKSQSATQQPNKLSNPLTLKSSSPVSTLSSSIVREVFIPVLEKEVNEGKNFAQLRQIYNSIILSHWYKTNLKNSILNKVYSDQKKIEGLKGQRNKGIKESQNSKGKIQNETQQPNEPDKLSNPLTLKSSDLQSEVQIIYQQYLDTFKQGVCNMMKVEYDPYARKNIPRKYFAGGVDITSFGKGAGHAYRETNNKTACSAIVNKLKFATIILVTAGMSLFGVKDVKAEESVIVKKKDLSEAPFTQISDKNDLKNNTAAYDGKFFGETETPLAPLLIVDPDQSPDPFDSSLIVFSTKMILGEENVDVMFSKEDKGGFGEMTDGSIKIYLGSIMSGIQKTIDSLLNNNSFLRGVASHDLLLMDPEDLKARLSIDLVRLVVVHELTHQRRTQEDYRARQIDNLEKLFRIYKIKEGDPFGIAFELEAYLSMLCSGDHARLTLARLWLLEGTAREHSREYYSSRVIARELFLMLGYRDFVKKHYPKKMSGFKTGRIYYDLDAVQEFLRFVSNEAVIRAAQKFYRNVFRQDPIQEIEPIHQDVDRFIRDHAKSAGASSALTPDGYAQRVLQRKRALQELKATMLSGGSLASDDFLDGLKDIFSRIPILDEEIDRLFPDVYAQEDIERFILSSGQVDPYTKKMLEYSLKRFREIAIQVKIDRYQSKRGSVASRPVRISLRQALILYSLHDYKSPQDVLAWIFLHEINHWLSFRWDNEHDDPLDFYAFPNFDETQGYTPADLQILKQCFSRFIEREKQKPFFDQRRPFERHLHSLEEFLADATSNPDFAKYLHNIPMAQGQTRYQAHIEQLLTSLGAESADQSVLTNVLGIYLGRLNARRRQLAGRYGRLSSKKDMSAVSSALTDQEREAFKNFKGFLEQRKVYALDGSFEDLTLFVDIDLDALGVDAHRFNVYLVDPQGRRSEKSFFVAELFPSTKDLFVDAWNPLPAETTFVTFDNNGQATYDRIDRDLSASFATTQILKILSEALPGFRVQGVLQTLLYMDQNTQFETFYDQSTGLFKKLKNDEDGYYWLLEDLDRDIHRAKIAAKDQTISPKQFIGLEFFNDIQAASFFEEVDFYWLRQGEKVFHGLSEAMKNLMHYYENANLEIDLAQELASVGIGDPLLAGYTSIFDFGEFYFEARFPESPKEVFGIKTASSSLGNFDAIKDILEDLQKLIPVSLDVVQLKFKAYNKRAKILPYAGFLGARDDREIASYLFSNEFQIDLIIDGHPLFFIYKNSQSVDFFYGWTEQGYKEYFTRYVTDNIGDFIYNVYSDNEISDIEIIPPTDKERFSCFFDLILLDGGFRENHSFASLNFILDDQGQAQVKFLYGPQQKLLTNNEDLFRGLIPGIEKFWNKNNQQQLEALGQRSSSVITRSGVSIYVDGQGRQRIDMDTVQDEEIKDFLRAIAQPDLVGKVFVYGGAVRDLLFGSLVRDIDYLLTADTTEEDFRAKAFPYLKATTIMKKHNMGQRVRNVDDVRFSFGGIELSINKMFLYFDGSSTDPVLEDPQNGLKDLMSQTARATYDNDDYRQTRQKFSRIMEKMIRFGLVPDSRTERVLRDCILHYKGQLMDFPVFNVYKAWDGILHRGVNFLSAQELWDAIIDWQESYRRDMAEGRPQGLNDGEGDLLEKLGFRTKEALAVHLQGVLIKDGSMVTTVASSGLHGRWKDIIPKLLDLADQGRIKAVFIDLDNTVFYPAGFIGSEKQKNESIIKLATYLITEGMKNKNVLHVDEQEVLAAIDQAKRIVYPQGDHDEERMAQHQFFLSDINPEMLRMLRRKGVQIFGFTARPSIPSKMRITLDILRSLGINGDIFDKVIFTSGDGKIKADRLSFEIKELRKEFKKKGWQVPSREIFLIDDLKKNIIAAEKLGYQITSVLVEPENGVVDKTWEDFLQLARQAKKDGSPEHVFEHMLNAYVLAPRNERMKALRLARDILTKKDFEKLSQELVGGTRSKQRPFKDLEAVYIINPDEYFDMDFLSRDEIEGFVRDQFNKPQNFSLDHGPAKIEGISSAIHTASQDVSLTRQKAQELVEKHSPLILTSQEIFSEDRDQQVSKMAEEFFKNLSLKSHREDDQEVAETLAFIMEELIANSMDSILSTESGAVSVSEEILRQKRSHDHQIVVNLKVDDYQFSIEVIDTGLGIYSPTTSEKRLSGVRQSGGFGEALSMARRYLKELFDGARIDQRLGGQAGRAVDQGSLTVIQIPLTSLAPGSFVDEEKDHLFDQDMEKSTGGIDFNKKNMNVNILGAGDVLELLNSNSANLQSPINSSSFEGLQPIIINIQPFHSLPSFLGLGEPSQAKELSSL